MPIDKITVHVKGESNGNLIMDLGEIQLTIVPYGRGIGVNQSRPDGKTMRQIAYYTNETQKWEYCGSGKGTYANKKLGSKPRKVNTKSMLKPNPGVGGPGVLADEDPIEET